MLDGVNDSVAQAHQLAALLDPQDLQGQPDPVQPDRLDLRRLHPRRDRGLHATCSSEHGIDATVRLTRGRDIDAACGQLAAKGDPAPATG